MENDAFTSSVDVGYGGSGAEHDRAGRASTPDGVMVGLGFARSDGAASIRAQQVAGAVHSTDNGAVLNRKETQPTVVQQARRQSVTSAPSARARIEDAFPTRVIEGSSMVDAQISDALESAAQQDRDQEGGQADTHVFLDCSKRNCLLISFSDVPMKLYDE